MTFTAETPCLPVGPPTFSTFAISKIPDRRNAGDDVA